MVHSPPFLPPRASRVLLEGYSSIGQKLPLTRQKAVPGTVQANYKVSKRQAPDNVPTVREREVSPQHHSRHMAEGERETVSKKEAALKTVLPRGTKSYAARAHTHAHTRTRTTKLSVLNTQFENAWFNTHLDKAVGFCNDRPKHPTHNMYNRSRANSPPLQSFLEGPSTVFCVAVTACTVVMRPSLRPNVSLTTCEGGTDRTWKQRQTSRQPV